jgi:hypothetical protein
MIKIHISEEFIAAHGLNNDEIIPAIQRCMAYAKSQFGDLPLEMECSTWDMCYGDVLPNGMVIISPNMSAWNAKERLKKIRERLKKFGRSSTHETP